MPRYNLQGRQVALNAAREGITLLKNQGNLLPLDQHKTKSVLVVGPNAYPAAPVGGGSAAVERFASVSFLEGLSNYPARDFRLVPLTIAACSPTAIGHWLRTSLLLETMARQVCRQNILKPGF